MKEYKGIIKNILVSDSSIDQNITFIVKVGLKELYITLPNSNSYISFNKGDEVIVEEDRILGNKSYNIFHKGDDYHD